MHSGCSPMHESLVVYCEDAQKMGKSGPFWRTAVSGFRAREHETSRGFRRQDLGLL